MSSVQRLARLFFRDRDDNQGYTTLRLSSLTSLGDTLSSVLSDVVPAAHGVTDAIVTLASVIYAQPEDNPPPSTGSLMTYTCLVLWRNTDDNLASLVIPAFKSTIDISSPGSYGDVLDLAVFDGLTAALAALEALDSELVPINGEVVAAALIV